MSDIYKELAAYLGVLELTNNERSACAFGGNAVIGMRIKSKNVEAITADRDEWKLQHENLLSVRQSDLQVIAKLEQQLRDCRRNTLEEVLATTGWDNDSRYLSRLDVQELLDKETK